MQFNEYEVRPWGEYRVLASTDSFQIKVIRVNPNSRLSLQRHKHRAERWYILSGIATVTLNDSVIEVGPGDSVFVRIGDIHRIQAHDEQVSFVEVQTGTYFGEDDIERLSDDYERK